MKIVIFGAGLTGFELTRRLVLEKRDVVVIDNNMDILKDISNHFDCITIFNDGKNMKNIESAGLDDTDYFFALTTYDELNILSCRLAKAKNENIKTVAGVRNYSYSHLDKEEISILGADYIVNARNEIFKSIIESIEHGAVGNSIHFEAADFELREMVITHKSLFCSGDIQSIRKKFNFDFVIPVIFRGNEYVIPSGKSVLLENDIVYFFASKESLDNIFKLEGIFKEELKKMIIFGASDIGVEIADYFSSHIKETRIKKWFSKKENIILVESDLKKAESASAKLENVFVMQSDITDEEFIKHTLKKYDVFLALSDNFELNIIAASYVKSMGIKRSIAMVAKNDYLKMAYKMDIDTVLSIRNAAADKLVSIIQSDKVLSVHTIFSGEIEAAELVAGEKSKLLNKEIKKLTLPDNITILFIEHNDKSIIATGTSKIDATDTVACLGTREAISAMRDILR